MNPEETLLLGTLKEPPGGSQAFLSPNGRGGVPNLVTQTVCFAA